MPSTVVLSIQVSLPREHLDGDRPWRTAYLKQPVAGPVEVGHESIAGDGQANLGPHGGPDRAVLGYASAHYDAWRAEFPGKEFLPGALGENITVTGLDERTVCIGDRHHIGEVVLEVSMPRSPCPKISKANALATLYDRVEETGRIGWLYRVVKQGAFEAGQPITVEAGPNPDWTVARTFDVYRRARRKDAAVREDARALAQVPTLAAAWRERLQAFADSEDSALA